MRTTKPISTITYNSPSYLRLKLEELRSSGKVTFWAFVPHKPEDDEAGNKPHAHLYIEPSKILQTDDLKEFLKEYDPTHPDRPLGCISFRSSKFDHWYLYGLHDKRYLASKGQSRRFHYLHEDVVSSDPDELLFLARSIDLMSLSPYADMQDAQAHGVTWAEYFRRGTIPLPQVALFEKAWYMLLETGTDRDDRTTHTPKIDTDTGEVFETPPQSPQKSLQSPVVPSWYEVHPQGDFVSLDPDTELPW